MHTVTMVVNDTRVAVNHNGDWSGDAIVFVHDGPNDTYRQVTLPAAVFVHVAKVINEDALTSILEDID